MNARSATTAASRAPHQTTTASGDAAQDEIFWRAVVTRDRDFDGRFYYSVTTTGVYCRPSCPSRRAKRENVAFHRSCAAAEAAGYRPCKRCRPGSDLSSDARLAAKIAQACRLIEAAETAPHLDELASAVALSASHFHRLFKAVVGVTPRAYANAQRHRRVRGALASSASVTEAIFEAGYSSSGRFYTGSGHVLGMTPSRVRTGGAGVHLRFAVGPCSLGTVLAAASDRGIAAILLGDDPEALIHDLENRFPNATLVGGDPAFEDIMAKIVGLVETPGAGLDLPLDIRGTAFQYRVWEALKEIPPGSTATYAEIARRIGMPKAVRAVATACAANRIAVAIPCHRVVRNDGGLAGYRWGIERKRALIARERKP